MIIQFTGFAPDSDPTTPGVITELSNMIPSMRGYKGAPEGVDIGMSALAAAAINAGLMIKLDGSRRLIAGTATKLYEKSGTAWSDVSRAAAYNATTTYPWRFAQFGNSTLAVNKGDVIQKSITGAFADLTAPKANLICTANGFVVVADTNEATYGDSPDRWWCSALLNETDWVPSISTQCTTGQLVDTAGAIKAMKTLGDNIIMYKDRSMYIGTYAGPPGVWNFSLIPGEIGCSAQDAVIDIGTAHVFIGADDFYIFKGGIPEPIGTPIREWFFNDLDPNYKEMIKSAHDRTKSIIYFHYSKTASLGVLNGCIAYNYKTNKWGVAHKTVESVVEYYNGGYTWDTLPTIGKTWDEWPNIPYDSPWWTAGSLYPAYFGTDHKIYGLTGTSTSSSLTTGAYGNENEYALLDRVTLRYLVRPVTAAMTNYYQDILGEVWTQDVITAEYSGRFDLLRSAPWHKVKFNFTGDVEIVAATANLKFDGVL